MSRIVLLLLTAGLYGQTPLTPEEERGRQIYERGTSPSGGTIEATIAGDTRVPGAILPCVNCHGPDGAGKPEGGVVPSNIGWDALTKPYGLTHPGGRTHPPYSERLLKRAIALGMDPAGNSLHAAMPRFQLSLADASDLVAYIKRLGNRVDPGITATTVRLGVVVPARPAARARNPLNQALLDYFARVNAAGGIFGRRVELSFGELPSLRDFLRDEQVFAIVGDFTGAESTVAAALQETGTPAIAALAPFPPAGSTPNPYVFYLDGGVQAELAALLEFAARRFPGSENRTVVVSSTDGASSEAAKWIQTRLADSGHPAATAAGDAPVMADVVYWLKRATASPTVVTGANRQPVWLIPGSLVESQASLARIPDARIFVALGDSAGIGTRAIAAAALFCEGLKLAGRGLSRPALIAGLEGVREAETNLPRPITFGPARRIGAEGPRIMVFDPRTRAFTPVPASAPSK